MQYLNTYLLASLSLYLGLMAMPAAQAATIPKTVCVSTLNKEMLDGNTVTFWGFTDQCGMGMGMGGGGMSAGQVPGPQIDINVGDTLSLTLNMMMAPQEDAPYNGHTIHMHGADVNTDNDGVPDTNGGKVNGATYVWAPTATMPGTYMYHCHVHTVKHLEMGMYAPLIVHRTNASGVRLNQLTSDPLTAFAYEQTYLFSTVDPAYHTATGDSTVFADYNPVYFLINGNEGKTTIKPAATKAMAVNSKVALRLIGAHSVSSTFRIKDGATDTPFTVYIQDGRQLATPETVTSLDISPGQRFDIVFSIPGTSPGALYPQITYKSLRSGGPDYATVYGQITF